MSAGDTNADGVPDLLILGVHFAYLVSGRHLEAADLADGNDDGVVELKDIARLADSWTLRVRHDWLAPSAILSGKGVGDLDGDGFADLAIGAQHEDSDFADDPGAAYFVSATDLPLLDAADGIQDGVVNLELIDQ